MAGEKRVLIKISGEVMNGMSDTVYRAEDIETIAQKLIDLQATGLEIAVVVGGGNIWRWKDTQDLKIPRVVSDYLGMTATIMNAVVLGETITRLGGKSLVYSPEATQIPNGTQVYGARKAIDALHCGSIVLCAGGVPAPYSTTDAASVQRALELDCDSMIKCTKVDALYDKDPLKYDDAVKFDEISYDEALRLGVEVMDHHAFALAKTEGLVLYVCHMDTLDLIGTNDMKGTRISA